MIRVELPPHLKILARIKDEVQLEVAEPVSIAAILTALEASYPMLRGTIREHVTLKRRAMVRYFASGEDLSHEPADAPLPAAIANGEEPLIIVAAIAGG
jgi:hypothetical protein